MKLFGLIPGREGLHHFSPSRVYVDREAKVAVVLNPKVGSSYLRDLLAHGVMAHRDLKDPSNGRYRLFSMARRFPMAPARDYIHLVTHPRDYEAFAFVRNPYERLKSAWKDKYFNGHHKGYPKRFQGRRLSSMRAFAAAHGLEGARDGTLIPFSTFVRFVERGVPGRMDHHWDVQQKVLMTDQFDYARAFRIEDEFETGMQTIAERLGFAAGWHKTVGEGRRNASASDALEVYDATIAAVVFETFKADFAGFGYDRDSWHGH